MTPSEKDWIFISDAHFTGQDSESMELFLRFLDTERRKIGHLVILGDLFEFLFGFKNSFSTESPSVFSEYLPVLGKLRSLCREGIQIRYFEGNHDFYLRSFFSDYFGSKVEVYPNGCEQTVEGKRAFIAHGDLSNPRQWSYRVLRGILKNPLTYRLLRLAGPSIVCPVARKWSSMSFRKYHNEGQLHPPPAFKTFAHRKFLEGFEVVILGHSHFPEAVEEWIDGRRRLYYNPGDWAVHRSFLRLTPPDGFQLERYSE